MEAMEGDLDADDERAVADARELIDRAQASLPSTLREDVGPMLDLMERGIAAAEEGEDPNAVFADDPGSIDVAMTAAESMQTYREEECGEAP